MAVRGYDIEGPWFVEDRFKGDWKAQFEAEEAALAALQEVSDKATEESPKGFIVKFQVADGYAMYVVDKLRPLTLRHIPFGDGYQIPDAYLRGLNLADVKEQIRFHRVWASR